MVKLVSVQNLFGVCWFRD